MKILIDKCSRAKETLDDNDKKHFFGVYEGPPEKFQFMLGELKLLHSAAQYVNQIHNSEGFAEFLQHFTIPDKYVMSKSNTDQMSVGAFFGKKDRINYKPQELTNVDMSAQVFSKVELTFRKFADNGLVPVREITQDIIKIVNFAKGFEQTLFVSFVL